MLSRSEAESASGVSSAGAGGWVHTSDSQRCQGLGNRQNIEQLPAQGQHRRAGGGDSLSSYRTINMAVEDRRGREVGNARTDPVS